MSRTYKTDPYTVRKAREPGLGVWKSACGAGCAYCGIGRARRRWSMRAARSRVRRDLNRGIRPEAYTDDVCPVWVHMAT